jgi:ABC-type lipoprotein export system ATPase subunit
MGIDRPYAVADYWAASAAPTSLRAPGAARLTTNLDPVPVLSALGVRKTVGSGRGGRLVLDGVELEVERGELVAVLGRSGSGKSTLLHLLGGLDRPDAGSIAIAGQQIERADDRSLARIRLRAVGFVFQSFALVDELSGEDNVLLPTRLPGAPPGGRRRAQRLIDELGVRGVAHRPPHELSGGERQRFAIARALVNDPALVLADEPTGNLDSAAAADVLGLLRGLTDHGCGVVVVTHENDTTAAADRVLRLVDGRLECASREPHRV